MILKPKAVMFLATGAHVGRIPFASGTFGSLVALPIVFLFSRADWAVAFILTAILVLFSVRVAHLAEQQLKLKDPGCIVIDEIAGMCVTMLAIPLTLTTGLAGFILFRFFDVIKPPPARQMERLQGGWGVVMDDVVAGIMANILLRIWVALMGA
jgi:phosphatidylglycerophosphatase A